MLAQQRRGPGQSRLAAWQGFAVVLLLTAAALLYVKFQAVSVESSCVSLANFFCWAASSEQPCAACMQCNKQQLSA